MIAGLLLLLASPQPAHIAPAAIDSILAEAEKIGTAKTASIPAGLPLAAGLFAGKPWWAVLQMCSEHRSGAGRAPGAPAPELTELVEKNRLFFMKRAIAQFARDQDMTPDDATLLVSGWGSEFGAAMSAAAASGIWSGREFEDACRIIGMQHLRGVQTP
jgi:hypothetical protein